jgi:hypothetical protein
MEALLHTDSFVAKASVAIGVVALVAIATHLFNTIRNAWALSKFPIANEKWDAEAKKKFTASAEEAIARGVALVSHIRRFK